MSKNRHDQYPNHFFIDRRETPEDKWEFLYRDNDEPVMKMRFAYAAEMLRPDSSVRLINPAGEVVEQRDFIKKSECSS